ncbi:hypothetical protein OIU78_005305 [Salix suchowensis]|nr:hypothetical protein OIU78_005305 [Salix suchowensis]
MINSPVTPALLHNSKGLPIRVGEVDCPFYLKTGSCKYGATCHYNHPERTAINPPAAAIGHPIIAPFYGKSELWSFSIQLPLYIKLLTPDCLCWVWDQPSTLKDLDRQNVIST